MGGVRLERGELEIADRFEEQAAGPQRDADPGQGADGGLATSLAELHRQRHDEHQHALEPEHSDQADHGEAGTPVLAHRPVPIVLLLAVVAPAEVERQAQAPHRRHADQEVLSECGSVVDAQPNGPCHEHEAEPPHDVDDRGVLDDEARDPRAEHQDDDDDGGGGEGRLDGAHRFLSFCSIAWTARSLSSHCSSSQCVNASPSGTSLRATRRAWNSAGRGR